MSPFGNARNRTLCRNARELPLATEPLVTRITGGPTLANQTETMSSLPPDPVHFVAPDYTNWTVHEIHDPHTASGHSLIFVSPSGFRRVRDYPAAWRELSAQELWALSWQR